MVQMSICCNKITSTIAHLANSALPARVNPSVPGRDMQPAPQCVMQRLFFQGVMMDSRFALAK